jgi:hypothetical protein
MVYEQAVRFAAIASPITEVTPEIPVTGYITCGLSPYARDSCMK